MDKAMLDIYTDYLICQTKYSTATGLSDLLNGEISHDKVTRFLNKNEFNSKDLWDTVKPQVRKHSKEKDGVIILDDSIQEKPYTDENEIMCWHHSHSKGVHVKGVNILSCLARYDDLALPVCYELVHKDIPFSDLKTKKLKRKSSTTKNTHFRNLIGQCVKNQVPFDYVLADNWFGSKENLEYIYNKLNKSFIIGIKSNRTVALSLDEKQDGKFLKVSDLDIKDGDSMKVWMKGMDFQVLLVKKIFTNENGSTGVLYVVSNDLTKDGEHLYNIYQKRWRIEEYHKSIKQNTSLAKSPTKRVKSQSNHIFASIVAFIKLEMLKVEKAINHFALKYKLVLAANRAAWKEMQILKTNSNFDVLRA